MKVKLISYSKPHDIDSNQNIQDLVAYCARVSNPANQNNTKTNEKLIKYGMVSAKQSYISSVLFSDDTQIKLFSGKLFKAS